MNAFFVEGLEKRYGKQVTLNLESLAIASAKVTAVMGHNGAGKTTLLKLLGLIERPDRGIISFEGNPVGKSEKDRLRLRKKMGFIWQNPYFFNASIFENIALGLHFRGLPDLEIRRRVEEISDRLGIAQLLKKRPQNVSGGEAQRISIARTLVCKPDVVFVDEPNVNLDIAGMKLLDELLDMLKGGPTVVMATHDLRSLERADDLIILRKGRLEYAGGTGAIGRNELEGLLQA